MLLALFTGLRFWEGMELDVRAVALGAALSLPIIVGVTGLAKISWGPINRIVIDIERIISCFQVCTVTDLIVLSVLAGLGEEALFRGILQPYIANLTGPIPSLLITAAIFGALHAISFSYAFFAALVGLYLGALLLCFDNLLIPMVAHAVYDFLAFIYLLRIRRIKNALPDS